MLNSILQVMVALTLWNTLPVDLHSAVSDTDEDLSLVSCSLIIVTLCLFCVCWFSSSVNSWLCCFLPGVRLYHTVTSLPRGGVVVYGGRSSPLNPIRSLFRVTLEPGSSEGGQDTLKLCVEEMVCTGDPPPARWRHTAAVVSHSGEINLECDFFHSLCQSVSHLFILH